MIVDILLDVMQYTDYVPNIANVLYANKALYTESKLTRERYIQNKYFAEQTPTLSAKQQLHRLATKGLPQRYTKLLTYLKLNHNVNCPRFIFMFCPTIWDNDFRQNHDDGPYTFRDLMCWYSIFTKTEPSYSMIDVLIHDVQGLMRKNEKCISKYPSSDKVEWSKVELNALQNFYVYLSSRYFYMIE